MNENVTNRIKGRKATMNPYYAGVLLGVTLLLSYLILGAGLGASSGIARVGAYIELSLAPARTLASEYFGRWGEQPLQYYLVFMLAGVFWRPDFGIVGQSLRCQGRARREMFTQKTAPFCFGWRYPRWVRQSSRQRMHFRASSVGKRGACYGKPSLPHMCLCGRLLDSLVCKEAVG